MTFSAISNEDIQTTVRTLATFRKMGVQAAVAKLNDDALTSSVLALCEPATTDRDVIEVLDAIASEAFETEAFRLRKEP
jgi:hypothetical protein